MTSDSIPPLPHERSPDLPEGARTVIASGPSLHAQTQYVVRHRLRALEQIKHVVTDDGDIGLFCLPDEHRGIYLECSGHQLQVQVALGIIVIESYRIKGLSYPQAGEGYELRNFSVAVR